MKTFLSDKKVLWFFFKNRGKISQSGRATSNKFSFNHELPKSLWYSLDQTQKDKTSLGNLITRLWMSKL